MSFKVLIVDDSVAVRSVIQVYFALGKRKVELFEAQDGARGLHMARLMPFDLILLDLMMPAMDGLEVLHALREDTRPSLRKVPVILLTGVESELICERALAAGANAFLHKPVSAGALNTALEQLLGKA